MRKLYIKSLQDNVEILFPVTPFITWKTGLNKTSVDLYGFGEIGTGATAKLATWTIEGFFPHPNNEYDFLASDNKGTNYYINYIYKWQKGQHILQFKYTDDNGIGISTWTCKIDTFEFGERDGSMDIFYTLGFTEYRELKLDGLYINRAKEIAVNKGTTYMVKNGDNLLIIASKVYGDSSKYKQIMNNNSIVNPLDIKAGQVLKV
ncbi:MAG: LysM peptidoglycan-binding domain-containing protein [Clostridium butyricum]|nr:LysM peptidoglycan-binding domain-containing protein [Clostridium butyricum]